MARAKVAERKDPRPQSRKVGAMPGQVLSGRMTYAEAGVDIAAADEAVKKIWAIAQETIGESVIQGVGPFCATIAVDNETALVASADGLGTKSRILALLDRYDVAGEDIVSHSLNDILTSGAKPMFFLDYIGSSSLTNEQKERIVRGIGRACREVACPLVGGETADMPDVYASGDFDLVGFIVGTVDRNKVIDGTKSIVRGDLLLGMPAAGLHTNGYSMVRKVFGIGKHEDPSEDVARLSEYSEELGETLGDALARPHRCYYKDLRPILPNVKGIAHITGGGLPGNLPRILPEGLAALLRSASWDVPPIFRLIQNRGNIERGEMFRIFNMGVGLVIAVEPSALDAVSSALPEAFVVGEVIAAEGGERVIID